MFFLEVVGTDDVVEGPIDGLGVAAGVHGLQPEAEIAHRSFGLVIFLLGAGLAAMDHDRGMLNLYGCRCWCKAGMVDETPLTQRAHS